MKRIGAMAALLAVGLLSAGEARAQSRALKFHDVTEVLAPASVGTVPTDHPDIPDSYALGPNLVVDGALSFAEGDLRTYEFFAAADGAKSSMSTVRIELLGEGRDAYRLSAGALSAAGLPIIPREPSLSTTALTLSGAAHGDLLRIRARRDDDLAAPARAVLRISFVSGEAISNLPLEFALTTMDAGRQLGVSDVTDQVRGAHTSASVVIWEHNEANRVRGGDHLLLGEGLARTYALRAPLGLFALPSLSISLEGAGAGQFKVGVGLLSTPNLDRADVAPAANGEIVITLMAAADADADAATATLSITQADGSSPALSNLPLVFALSSVDYDASAVAPFVPGDVGRFILTPSVSEAAAGAYVTFDLAVDLGVSHGCKDSHCRISLMALEIVWDDADFILDTDAMDAVLQSDSTGTIYYVARGARRDDDPANGVQPDAADRLRLIQNPSDGDYDILYFTRAGTRSKLVMLLLDSFEDTDREIRCDAEDAASSRYCGDFQLLRFGLFARIEPAVGERLAVEARLWRADADDADASPAGRRIREVADAGAVNPVVAYESDSAAITVIPRGAASLALEPATPSRSISTLETAEASATVAFLTIADAGDDHLPTLLSAVWLKYAEDGVVGAEVADMRMAVTGPGLSAPVVGERDAATNTFRFDFSALSAGGLLVSDGAVGAWAVTVWMDDMGANRTYADQTSFTLGVAHHISPERRERRFSEGVVDASRNAVDFHIDIVGTRLQIGGGVDAIRETLTIPPADARIATFTLQIADAKGSVDRDWTGNWTSVPGVVTFGGAFSGASHPFVNGESQMTDARLGFAPAYGDDGGIGGITFGLDREGVDASGPRFDFELEARAQSLIATEPPTVTEGPDIGASLSVPLHAVAFYRQVAAGDCRAFAQNCVMDKDFNGDVAITASVGVVGDTTATSDLAPVIVNFASGRAMLELDLAAASLPNLGLLAVTLNYPALDPAHRAFAVTLATVPYNFRRLRLAFEETSTLRVDENAVSQRVCVASSVANFDDSATVEVTLSLTGGTAVRGEDYTLAVGDEFSLRIASGESRACQALTLIDDAVAERDEHLEFQITQVAHTGGGSTLTELVRSEDALRLVIRNDDDVTVRVAPDAVELRERTADGRVPASANLRVSLWDGLNANRFGDNLGGRHALRFSIAEGSASLAGVCPADAATILAAGDDFCLRLSGDAGADVALTAADTAAGATFSLEYERNGVDRFTIEIVAPGDGILEGRDSFEVGIGGLNASTDSVYVWPSTATALELADDNPSVALEILDIEVAALTLADADGGAVTAVTLGSTPSVVFHVELRERDTAAALAPDEDVAVQITIGDLDHVTFVGRATATRTLNLVIAANTTRTAGFRLIAGDNDLPESGRVDLLARSGGADAPLPTDAAASIDLLSVGRVRTMYFYDVTAVVAPAPAGTVPIHHPSIPAPYALGPNIAAVGALRFAEGDLRTYEFFALDNNLESAASVVRIELLGEGAGAYRLSVGARDDGSGLATIPPEPSLSSATLTLAMGGSRVGDFLRIRALRDDDTAYPPPARLRISHVLGDIFSNLPLEFALATSEPAVVDVETFAARDAADGADLILVEDNDASAFLRVSLALPDGGGAYADVGGGVGTLTLTFESDGRPSGASLLCPADLADLSGFGIDICVRPVADANYALVAEGSSLHLTYRRDGPSAFWLEIAAPADDTDETITRVSFSLGRIAVGDDTWMKGRHEGVVTVIDGDATYAMRFHDVTEIFAPAPVGTIPTEHPGIPVSFASGPDIAAAGALVFIEGDLRIYEFYGDDAGGKPLESVVRVELLGEGAGAYRLSADNFTIPPEPSLSSATLALSGDLYVGDVLKIRSLADGDTTPPPPARLRISRVSGELFDNLPLEFALTTLERVNVDVETFVARAAADRGPLALIENNDASGFLRVSLRHADGGGEYFDAAGGVGTLTLSFESAGHGFDDFSVLCRDDLRDYAFSSVDVCVRAVADANYTLSAAGGALRLTYRRDGQSMFWLQVVAPEDLAVDQTTPIRFSLERAPESAAGVAFAPGAHEGVITVIDAAPVLHDLRVERAGDASYLTTEDYAHATTLSVTLRLSGFDQYGDAIAIRGVDEVSAASAAGARLLSFETAGADRAVATLTLTIGPVSPDGDRVTIIVRAGDVYRIEPLERRTDVDVGAAPFIYGLRDITELNRGRAEGSHALRGSGPPLSADATIEIPLGGAALLEFYPVQIGSHRGALHARLHFEGDAADRYRMRSSLSPVAPPSTSTQGVIPPIGQGGLASQDWDLHAAFGFTAMTYGVVRIPAAARTSVTTFKISHLRGDWPVAGFPLGVKVRTVEPYLDVEVYPLVSISPFLEPAEDVEKFLDTRATAEAPASIALLAIADGGDNASETALDHLRVILTPAGDDDIAGLKARLRAFTFVLRDVRVAGLIEAPESARVNSPMSLVEHGDVLRLQVWFETPPRIPDGETVYYEIVAYYSDASVRVDEDVGFRVHFGDDVVDVRGGRVSRINTTAGFDVNFSVMATEFRLDGVATAGVASTDAYFVGDADWPILRVDGAFTDVFGNVDAQVARFGVGGIDAVGVIRRVGRDVEVEVTPTAVAAGHLDFGESGLAAFIAELQRLGGGEDAADGTRWMLTIKFAGVLGDTSSAFTVRVAGPSPPLEIFDPRLMRKLEHDTASPLNLRAMAGGGDADLNDIVVTGACANRVASCGAVEAAPASRGFTITPVLGADYSLKYGAGMRLTFHYTVPGTTPIPAVQRVTLSAEDLSEASPIRDFEVLPTPIEVFFERREYRVGEDAINADLSIVSNPDYNRRNLPSPLPAWRVRVAIGAAMTGYAGWPPSIAPGGANFAELEFDSATMRSLYPVPIVDDTTYKPRETRDFRIVSVHFADGDAARHNFGSGHATATIVVADDDSVDVNAAAYPARDAIAANPLELTESNNANAFLRLYLTETDGGGAYYDAAGGAATLTLSFSSDGSAFGASLLCPEDLRDLFGVAVDICLRPTIDADYALVDAGAGAVDLVYTRDGRHEFWLEVVAPREGVKESTVTVAFALSAMDAGGDPWRAGISDGGISIFDDSRFTQLAFEGAPAPTVTEADAAHEICVEAAPANGADAASIELGVSLIGGTAVADEDYTLAGGGTLTLTIGAGESRACRTLTLLDDALAERDEHLEFQITQAAYVGVGYAVTELIRSEDVLRLVIQDDDDVTVRIAPSAVEFREQTPDGGGVAASASLQISLWDGLNAARYSDDLGGRRALRFNVAAGSASLSGVCPADAATISADGADFCLRLPAGAAAGVDLSAADTTAGATFSLEYERNGADRFVVEIVAPGDGVLEGRDSFEISIDGLSASVDSVYVWPSTATAPGLAGQNLSVAMHILDAEEAVPVLVDAEGLALRSVTLIENAPSAALHAELRDAGGAALAPDEDVGVQITISGLAGVSFVGRSTATRTLDLTIAANATRTASFRLIAAADDNSIPESGTLGLLARGGGADAPLPADAEASAPVRVRDLDFVPSALLFNGVAEARMALRQAQARQMVTATLSFSGLNQYDEPMDLRAVAVEVRANDGATADLRRASSPDGFVTTLTLLIETDEDRDATVTLTATLDGVSATATIRVAAAPRVARRIEVRATTAVLYASADAEGVAASFIVGVVDNYGDFGALASTVTLTAVADDGQTPFYPRRIAVPPGGVSVSVAVTPTVDADMRLSLSATRDGLAPGRAEVRVRAARALSALKLDGATTTTRFFDQRDVGLGQAVTARFVLRATDQYGDAFAVDAARIAVRTNSSATYALDRMLASDGLRSDLTLRITPFEDEDATLRLTASGGDRAMAQAVITVAAVARAIERLRVAGPTAALSQSGLDEPVEVIFNVAAVDNYGADDVLPATTATLEVSADDGRMPRAPAAARIEPGGVAVSVVVTPSAGVDVRVRLAATLGGLTETAEALVTAVEARRLDRLLLNGEAMTTLLLNQHSVGLRMPVSGELRLAALDQYGDPHATRVAVDASVVGGARLSGLPSSLTVRVTGADLSFEVLPDEDADAVLTLRVASGEVSAEAVIDVDAVDRRPQSLNLRRLADTVVQTEFNQTLVVMFDLELRDNYGDAGRLPPTLVNLEATVDRATAVMLSPSVLVSTPTTVEVRVTPQGQDDTLTLSARVGALVAVEMVDIDALETGSLTLDGDDSVRVNEEGIASFVMTLGATDSAGNLVALDGEVVRFTAVADNETIEIVSFAAVSRAGTSALSVAMASTEVASAEMSVDVEIRVRLRSVATVELTLRAQSAGVNLGDAVARVRVLPSVAAFDVDDNGEVEYDDLIVILRYLMLSPKERTAAPVASMTRNLRMSDRNGLIEKLSALNDPINDDLLDLDGDGEVNSYDGRLLVRYFMFGRTFTDYGDRVGERILRLMGM